MPPESSDREADALPAGGVSGSVWLTTGKQALKKNNTFYIHFLIPGSNLYFLFKTFFKVQNLFQ